MRGEIKRLQRRLGTTSIYVTHDQLEAMNTADRLVVLNGGQIEQIGSPLEVYHSPASTFVASFIGSPAITLCRRNCMATRLPSPGHHQSCRCHSISGEVTIGLRAEDLRLVQPARLALPSVWITSKNLAPKACAWLGWRSGTDGGHASQTVLPLEVRLTIDPGKLHFFAKETGKRFQSLSSQIQTRSYAPA